MCTVKSPNELPEGTAALAELPPPPRPRPAPTPLLVNALMEYSELLVNFSLVQVWSTERINTSSLALVVMSAR